MEAPAPQPSSSAAPAPSKAQRFWRARRKRRMETFPQTAAVVCGAFAVLGLVANGGAFAGWRAADAASDQLPGLPARQLAQPQSAAHGRQLQAYVPQVPGESAYMSAPMVFNLTYLNTLTCVPLGNGSSIFPALSFEETNRGAAIAFLVIVTLYMFLGLAIVCDSFFEAALSAICEAQNLKDDVAGATWMAAGGSAPELATSVIGVFISRSDVGIGTIVGSAVFNVLFVIACCAFVAPNLKLSWWPLARDAAYYCFALAMIVIFVSDDFQIAVWEATILLLMYAGYVTVMYFNERLELWVTERVRLNEMPGNGVQEMLKKVFDNPGFAICLYTIILANCIVVILEIINFNTRSMERPCVCGIYLGAGQLPVTGLFWVNMGFNAFFVLEMASKFYAYGFFGYWKIPLNCFDGSLVFLIFVEVIITEGARASAAAAGDFGAGNDAIGIGVARLLRLMKFVRVLRTVRVLRLFRGLGGSKNSTVQPEGATASGEVELGAKARTADGAVEKPKEEENTEGEDEEDDDDDGPFNPFEIWGDFESPGGIFGRCMWFIGLPLSVAFWLTIPDCRRPMFAKFWFFTFSNCIAWIAILATFMVWMVERIGKIYDIPDSIMGIFVLAAGTSIPDCLSSVAVARRGHGDMAVSSSIGSNIFDVLIGLPIPWFIYTAILRPAMGPELGPQWVPVQSAALAVYILILFVMVALVITTVHLSGWVLSIKLGGAMMGLYFGFLVIALLLDPITGPVVFGDCIPNWE